MIPTALQSLPALSIRQPWAWLIVNSTKRHENRVWSERYPARRFRGLFLIHAARGMTREEYDWACQFAEHCGVPTSYVPPFEDLPRGGIVGHANAVDFVEASTSPWFTGPGAIVITDPVPLPFTPCRGMLGFFRPQLLTKN